MENDPALDNLDIMSDTSTQMTQFTRYTRAASIVSTQSSLATFSTKTGSRKKEAKLKKKAERQKAGGKKGTVFEEDYLYSSVQKLIKDRLGAVQAEAFPFATPPPLRDLLFDPQQSQRSLLRIRSLRIRRQHCRRHPVAL